MRWVALFPGQGSQHVGMGRDYYDAHAIFRETMQEACEVLAEPLDALVFDGPSEALSLTPNAQPAILAVSVGMWRVLRQRVDQPPCLFIGHSLGEYTACVAGGVLELADGLRLVRRRAELMQKTLGAEQGAMAAILGLPLPAVERICVKASRQKSQVDVAADNAPGQTVVAGHRDAIDRAMAIALALGAEHAKLLDIRIASHCRSMAPAQTGLQTQLEQLPLRDPAAPLVMNATAATTQRAPKIREALVTQLTSRVHFAQSVHVAAHVNPRAWVEVGPAKILGGLVSRCLLDETRVHGCATLQDLTATFTALGASNTVHTGGES